MKSYSYFELIEALQAVGITDGQSVVVHSSLMHLGRMKEVKSSNIAAMHYSALREVLGPAGTVVVPTFNFGFCRGEAFDPATTPSVRMGMFSEYVRKLPDAIRSKHPMQSLAAIGPQAEYICNGDALSAYSLDGSFAKLLELNVRGLLLGVTMRHFSFVHFVEEQVKVPYRFTKTFTAPYGPTKQMKSYCMYVRDLDIDPKLDFLKVGVAMCKKNMIQENVLGIGAVQSFDINDVYATTLANLKADPYWLVSDIN